ncbi:MAG: hypothetical protein QOH42_236, partial [Blastocatellia bacterium]|nr:hypothetical protein [Blastocatellia bacterium]
MSSKNLIASSIVSLLFCGAVVAQTKPVPLPCAPARKGDTHPWTHNSEVLDSFPKDKSKRNIGAFRDKHRGYELQIYRDAKGVFGELLSPVLEADSPGSRLYDTSFDLKLGTLRFEAHFPFGDLQFTGVLRRRTIGGTVTQNGRSEKVILRRVRLPAEDPYISR